MPNWPSMYLPFFRDWGWISTYPDSRYVLEPMADYWAPPYSDTPAATYVRHSGLDAFSDWHHPIFAVEEGRVVEVLSATNPNGNFGTFKYTGNIVAVEMEGGLVAIDEHMSETHVSEGDIVTVETRLGLQGTSGDSSGEHDHFKLFRDGQPIDPMPYLLGLKPWKTVIPTPQEETAVNVKIIARYKITEPEIRLRSSPLTTAPIVGKVVAGDEIDASELVDGNGKTWANTGKGYCAIYDGATPWAVPVPPAIPDTSALEAQIAQQDAVTAMQGQLLTDNVAEVNRLREIILDGPRRMDP